MLRPRIAYVSLFSPLDPRAYQWSGTNWFLFRVLQRYVGDVFWPDIGCHYNWRFALSRLEEKLQRRAGRPCDLVLADEAYSQFVGERLGRALARTRYDIVLSISTAAVANLATTRPIVVFGDATFNNLVDYYPEYSGLSERAVRSGQAVERAALTRAAAAIYPGPWAARSAVEDYGMDPARVHHSAIGANLDEVWIPSAEACAVSGRRDCRLLLVGVDWQRKGGDKAVAITRALVRLGVPARLTVVGCRPPAPVDERLVELLPPVDKWASGGMERLASLYAAADYLVLPTVAECAGVVFSEASAFGVPSITHETGGVASTVSSGENGWRFALDAAPEEIAAVIAANFGDEAARVELRRRTKARYESCLAWRHGGRRMGAVIDALA